MNSMNTILFSVFIIFLTQGVWGANILYIALTASPSHTIWDKTLLMALQKNHKVTFVTLGPEIKSENVTTITIEGIYEKMNEDFELNELHDLSSKGQIDLLFEWMHTQNKHISQTETLKTFLRKIEGIKYDLIIWDLTTTHFLLPIIEKLNYPPVVLTSAFGAAPFYTRMFGYDFNLAYTPLWMMDYSEEMNFFQRISNLCAGLYTIYVRDCWYLPKERELAAKVFKKPNISFEKFEKHFSFLLINSDPVLDYPQILPPQVIQVGGLNIKRVEELPQDLKNFLDNSKNGAILFSLGTNIRSDQIPEKQRNAIIKVFSRLKQNILWKFESDLKGLPKNVIVRKWLPQNEILAHPNVKLFFSHGGALSTQEAIYHGVPVVGIPFIADQFVNLKKLMSRNLGEKIEFESLTEDLLYNTITKVLNDPIYKENVNKISRRYRDQPQNPLERALFWIEYTLRQGGGQHLRVASRDLSFIQLYYIDFWALIITVLFIILYTLKKIFKTKHSNNGNCKQKMN